MLTVLSIEEKREGKCVSRRGRRNKKNNAELKSLTRASVCVRACACVCGECHNLEQQAHHGRAADDRVVQQRLALEIALRTRGRQNQASQDPRFHKVWSKSRITDPI